MTYPPANQPPPANQQPPKPKQLPKSRGLPYLQSEQGRPPKPSQNPMSYYGAQQPNRRQPDAAHQSAAFGSPKQLASDPRYANSMAGYGPETAMRGREMLANAVDPASWYNMSKTPGEREAATQAQLANRQPKPPTDLSGPYGAGDAANWQQMYRDRLAGQARGQAKGRDQYAQHRQAVSTANQAMQAREVPITDPKKMRQDMAGVTAQYNVYKRGGGELDSRGWFEQMALRGSLSEDVMRQIEHNYGVQLPRLDGSDKTRLSGPHGLTAAPELPAQVDIEAPRRSAIDAAAERRDTRADAQAEGLAQRQRVAGDEAELNAQLAADRVSGFYRTYPARVAGQAMDKRLEDYYGQLSIQRDQEQKNKLAQIEAENKGDLATAQAGLVAKGQVEQAKTQKKADDTIRKLRDEGATPLEQDQAARMLGANPSNRPAPPNPDRSDRWNAALDQLETRAIDTSNPVDALNSFADVASGLPFEEIDQLGQYAGLDTSKEAVEAAVEKLGQDALEYANQEFRARYGNMPSYILEGFTDYDQKFEEFKNEYLTRYQGLTALAARRGIPAEAMPSAQMDWKYQKPTSGYSKIDQAANAETYAAQGLGYLLGF